MGRLAHLAPPVARIDGTAMARLIEAQMGETDITCEKIGRCGVITLNRPQALNALSFDMVDAMGHALEAFARAPEIRSVVVRTASAKAFCAGADIKRVAELGKEGRHDEQLAFLGAEYRNCHRIKHYPKPYIALIDGIIMGGGAGIAVNGAHRVVGDDVSFAMPEVGIGFFPDVGASYFLPRLAGCLGLYLALTGGRAALGDVVGLGLATAHIPSARFDALLDRLVDGDAADRAIAAETIASPPSELLCEQQFIARAFAAPSVVAIMSEVEAASRGGSPFAAVTLKALGSRSPTSLAVALKQMQYGPVLQFDEALKMEFRIASKIVHGHDFYEGVRAALVDKDYEPHWNPAEISKIATTYVDAYFAPLTAELKFSAPAGVA
jgi:enoyl-CoA hydratase